MGKVTIEKIVPAQYNEFYSKYLSKQLNELEAYDEGAHFSDICGVEAEDYRKYVRGESGREALWFKIPEEKDPIGFCLLRHRKTKKGMKQTFIHHFYISKDYRNKENKGFWQGYAEEAAKLVFKKSHKQVQLVYNEENKSAAGFWRKMENIFGTGACFIDRADVGTRFTFHNIISEKDDRTAAD